MNEDLIRRSDVLNLATCITKPTYDSPYCESVVYVEDIEAIPSIDTEPLRHGEWIPIKMEMRFGTLNGVKCSLCGEKKVREGSNYCPNCGAKMDGKKWKKESIMITQQENGFVNILSM